MSHLTNLNLKSVTRASKQDPVQKRREKLKVGIDEQLLVAAAAVKGDRYETKRKSWGKDENGEKVLVDRMRQVRPWFFEQDGGWYVQCKYGNKALALGKGNAVFVKALKDVEATLGALKAAADAGELDAAMSDAIARRK